MICYYCSYSATVHFFYKSSFISLDLLELNKLVINLVTSVIPLDMSILVSWSNRKRQHVCQVSYLADGLLDTLKRNERTV